MDRRVSHLKPYHEYPCATHSWLQELSHQTDMQAAKAVTASLADVTVLHSLKDRRFHCNKEAAAMKRAGAPREEESCDR
jgi:hypothetical protein